MSKMLVGNAMVGIYMYFWMQIARRNRSPQNNFHNQYIFWHCFDLGQNVLKTKKIYLNIHYAKLTMVNYRRLNNEKFESQIFTHNFGPTPNSTPNACVLLGLLSTVGYHQHAQKKN